MIFPFESLSGAQVELGMALAVLIGFGFGFVLERAGFGQATTLVAQFYLNDMTVFKVMFSGIVTAMLGMVVFAGLGLVDLRAVADQATSITWLVPLVVGGFLLGLGFIVSGYCPGTSLVSAASGNVDGMMTVAGVVLGTFLYSESTPLLGGFPEMTDLGHIYLYDLLGLPPSVVALLVALMAIGCFVGAEKVEKIFTKKMLGAEPSSELWPKAPRRFAFATFAGAAAIGLVTLALPRPSAAVAKKTVEPIGHAELARRVLEEPWAVRVLDLRSEEACRAQRVPGAECTPAATLEKLGLADEPAARELVLVADKDLGEPPAAALAYPGRVRALQGGFEGWKGFALTAPVLPENPTPEQLADYKLRGAVNAAMTGIKQAPPPAPAGGGTAAPRKKKGGGGCSG